MDRKILGVLIALNFVVLMNGQNEKWSIMVNYQPSMGYRFISGEDKDEISHYHRIGFTNSIGFNTHYKLSEKLTIGTGLNYDEYGYNKILDEYSDTGEYLKMRSRFRSKFANIPLIFTIYTTSKGYFRFGINNNILIRKTLHSDFQIPEQDEITEILNFSELIKLNLIRIYQPGIRLSYGYAENIGNGLSVILEPTINANLAPKNKNYDRINMRYFNVGLNIIVRYNNMTKTN